MNSFQPVKTQSCKSCGSTIHQYNADSETVICQHCGTLSTDTDSKSIAAKKSNNSYSLPENPILKLHETFTYESVTWQIIGCISYVGYVREWDSEDDVWESNPWKYNSWWVMNEARELAWIVHDSTGYKWSRKTVMTGRIPKNNRSYEEGTWNIISAVGEFSFFPKIGGEIITYEKDANSIEILLDSKGNKKEVEAFINAPIRPLHLFKAFNKTKLLADLERANLAFKIIGASALCLLIGFFALSIFTKTVLTIPTETIKHPLDKELINLGEFELNKKSLLQFKIESPPLRVNGNFDAELVIQDNRERIVSILPISLWRASGHDSDGSWTESNRVATPLLNLPANKKYTLLLKPTYLNRWKSINIKGQVKKNIASTPPIYLGGVLFVLLLIFQFAKRKNFIRKHTGLKT